MKRILFLLIGVLVVVGGLLFLFDYNQNPQRGHTDTVSSQKGKSASSNESAAGSSASSPSTATNAPASSSHSSAGSSSVPTSSSQLVSSSSSASAGSASTNTSSGMNSSVGTVSQTVNRPQGAWVKTFEKNLYHGYHVTPSRYVYIGRGYWEVWVKETNTGQYPYVTVNQYTGNFHG